MNKRVLVPNFVTVLNLLLGFLAILMATKGNYVTGSWFLIIAAVLDFLDGKIARATEGTTPFGLQFDSLADVVSFGVAPSFLIYSSQLNEAGPFGVIISFLPLLAGAIRLARYNVSKPVPRKDHFEGMPIPANAALICSYVLFSMHLWGDLRFRGVTALILIASAVLMVSTIEFDAMPRFSFRVGRRNTVVMILVVAAIALIGIFKEKAFFPLMASYVLAQVGRAFWQHFHFHEDEEESLADVLR